MMIGFMTKIDMKFRLAIKLSLVGKTVVLALLFAVTAGKVYGDEIEYPEDYNTWIAETAGKASDASNWSAGRAPERDDEILFDGRFSNADCEWDSDAAQKIASLTVQERYSGTITVNTEFPGWGDFEKFEIDGDVDLESGTLTCRGNYKNYGAASESATAKFSAKWYCLYLTVNGDLTVGENAKIDVSGNGFGYASAGGAPSYGGYAGSTDRASNPYGSIKEPFEPGMGALVSADANSKRSGIGGGAVWIEVTGDVNLDGEILSRGTVDLNDARASGTGGSIWIKAFEIGGAGAIDASAAAPSELTGGVALGSGGRISLVTTTPMNLNEVLVHCNGAAYAGTTPGETSMVSSCGTIYLKDIRNSDGILLLQQENSIATMNAATAAVPLIGNEEESCKFSYVEFSGCAVLALERGQSLYLVNGLGGVSAKNVSADHAGISLRGGSLTGISGDQTINGWTLEPVSPYIFPGKVTCANGGAIGLIRRFPRNVAEGAVIPRAVEFGATEWCTSDFDVIAGTNMVCAAISEAKTGKRTIAIANALDGGFTAYPEYTDYLDVTNSNREVSFSLQDSITMQLAGDLTVGAFATAGNDALCDLSGYTLTVDSALAGETLLESGTNVIASGSALASCSAFANNSTETSGTLVVRNAYDFLATIRMEGDSPIIGWNVTNENALALGYRYEVKGKTSLTESWGATNENSRLFKVFLTTNP